MDRWGQLNHHDLCDHHDPHPLKHLHSVLNLDHLLRPVQNLDLLTPDQDWRMDFLPAFAREDRFHC
ncbi:hypothetical protein D3C87_2180380 [compost metagenome]